MSVHVLLPQSKATSLEQDVASAPCARPSPGHRVLLRLEEKEMETLAREAPLLSLRLCQARDPQVGLRGAELPVGVPAARNPRVGAGASG